MPIKIKTIKPEKTPEYPALYEALPGKAENKVRKFIVLAIDPTTGVVIQSNEPLYSVGQSLANWVDFSNKTDWKRLGSIAEITVRQ